MIVASVIANDHVGSANWHLSRQPAEEVCDWRRLQTMKGLSKPKLSEKFAPGTDVMISKSIFAEKYGVFAPTTLSFCQNI
jgi:hypothetical protein